MLPYHHRPVRVWKKSAGEFFSQTPRRHSLLLTFPNSSWEEIALTILRFSAKSRTINFYVPPSHCWDDVFALSFECPPSSVHGMLDARRDSVDSNERSHWTKCVTSRVGCPVGDGHWPKFRVGKLDLLSVARIFLSVPLFLWIYFEFWLMWSNPNEQVRFF